MIGVVVDNIIIYCVDVFDGVCVKFDIVKVIIFVIFCDNWYVFVLNVFSLNGDGENDVFYVRSVIVIQIEFKVFDRWGEKIFELFNIMDGWDGIFCGCRVDLDVYDYYLRVVCDDGQEWIIKGNIIFIC